MYTVTEIISPGFVSEGSNLEDFSSSELDETWFGKDLGSKKGTLDKLNK